MSQILVAMNAASGYQMQQLFEHCVLDQERRPENP